MTTGKSGTAESVLVVCLYQSPLGETFIPLVRSDKWVTPFWKIPGGGVEENETPIKAASRELLEETGLIASGLLLVKTIQKPFWGNKMNRHIQVLYVANLENINTLKTTAVDGDQTLTIELFSIDDILGYLESNRLLYGSEILNAHARKIRETFDFINSL